MEEKVGERGGGWKRCWVEEEVGGREVSWKRSRVE